VTDIEDLLRRTQEKVRENTTLQKLELIIKKRKTEMVWAWLTETDDGRLPKQPGKHNTVGPRRLRTVS